MPRGKKEAEAGMAPAQPTEPSVEAPPTEPAPPSIEELQGKLEEAERRNRELFTKLQYSQADLENARKRAEREIGEAVRFGNEGLVASLLPSLDDLDAALAHLEGDASKGVAMVRDRVLEVLRDAGLEEVSASGPFDPYVHEAVGYEDAEGLDEGAIKDVVRKGYRFQFKLLRPAKVIVVRKGGEP